jgi:hypothetical protein
MDSATNFDELPDLPEEEVVQRHLGLGIDVLQVPAEALALLPHNPVQTIA